MKTLVKPMGRGYQTNCYILIKNNSSIVIDPGIGAIEWIAKNAPNPLAALNTHGHFDHTFSDAAAQRELKIPVYIRQEDGFMLKNDYFNMNQEPCEADYLVANEEQIEIGEFSFRFAHFPGHTPGCCMIEIDECVFSGDFIFDRCVGRYDFPASSAQDMKRSLNRFMALYGADGKDDRAIYPGHGAPTSIQKARSFLPYFIDEIV
ncbi:MAG: MBL fold metallo-hydrolase [Helicobacteraceae bacterium]|jgi:glyoxylase-like metal-dependent hydrolase (beta-lactamase superfamily II)|nr:MBL fold metallo-hydrolase [Helicobacteraceae bacterium]